MSDAGSAPSAPRGAPAYDITIRAGSSTGHSSAGPASGSLPRTRWHSTPAPESGTMPLTSLAHRGIPGARPAAGSGASGSDGYQSYGRSLSAIDSGHLRPCSPPASGGVAFVDAIGVLNQHPRKWGFRVSSARTASAVPGLGIRPDDGRIARQSTQTIATAVDMLLTPRTASKAFVPMPRLRVFAYSVGHAWNDSAAAMWFTYLLMYLEVVVKLSNAQAGAVMFSGQVADAIATPLVGILCDKTKGWPAIGLGRRKIWNFFGSIFMGGPFLLVFVVCVICLVMDQMTSSTARTINYAVASAIVNVGWAAGQVSHMSLVPDLTDDDSERVMLTTGRFCFTILANIGVFVVFFLLIHFTGKHGSLGADGAKFRWLAYYVTAVGFTCSTIFHLGTREPPRKPQKKKALAAGKRRASSKHGGPCDDRRARRSGAAGSTGSARTGGLEGADDASQALLGPEDRAGGAGAGADEVLSGSSTSLSGDLGAVVADAAERGAAVPLAAVVDDGNDAGGVADDDVVTVCSWFSRIMFYQTGIVYMCTRLVCNLSQVYIPFYIVVSLHMHDIAVALIPLMIYLSSLIFTSVVQRLNQWLGRKLAFATGAILSAGSFALMYVLEPSSSAWMYGVVIILGAGNAATMVSAIALEADLIGKHVETGGFVYGALSLLDKASNGVAVLTIQLLRSHVAPEDQASFIRGVTCVIPGIASVVSCIVVCTVVMPNAVGVRGRAGDVERRRRSRSRSKTSTSSKRSSRGKH